MSADTRKLTPESADVGSGAGGTEPVAGDVGLDVLDTAAAGGLIIRGGVLRFGGYAAAIALSVLSTALLTRHLQPAGFSQYTTILSLVGVVAVVTDAGMSNLGTREFAVRDGTERDELMRDLLGLRVSLTMVGVVLALVFALAAGYNTSLLLGTLAASIATVALVLQHTLSIPLMARLRLGTLSALELVRQALTVAAIVVLVLLGAGVLPLLTVTLAANLLLIPLTAIFVRGQISMGMELRPRRWLALLGLTVSFSLATAVGSIYVYTAQILTSLVASPHQSGLFAAPFRVFVVTVGIPGLLVGGALPMLARAARDDRERLAYALQRTFEVSLILGVAAMLATVSGARFIISVVAGPGYASSVAVLQILGVAMFASFLTAGWGFGLISLKRYRGLLLANAAALVMSATLTLVLASSHGARGAAVATLCGEVALSLGSLLALVRGHPEYRPHLGMVSKVALAAVPGFAVILFLSLTSFESMVIVLALYALLILLTRAVPQEMIDVIPRPAWARSRRISNR